jgi:hypothetical protein
MAYFSDKRELNVKTVMLSAALGCALMFGLIQSKLISPRIYSFLNPLAWIRGIKYSLCTLCLHMCVGSPFAHI